MKTSGNPSLLKVCLLALMFVSYTDTYVFAAPKGGHAVSGTASFTQDGNLTVITAGNRSIINYQSFNIAPGETVRFVQPNANSSVLNRVTSPNPTNIFGQLQANGNVYIVNPYGVFFQNGAVLNVGGLYAGAGKISDQDFTRGRRKFTDLTGDVRNDGVLAADNRIVLMGANVVNNGSMTSTHGLATMVSGKEVYVGERNSNVFVQANGRPGKAATTAAGAPSSGSITNNGTVSAPKVLLGAGDLYSTAIVNSGLLKGRDITVNAGRNGSATVGGTLDASATGASRGTAAATGGNIQVLGGSVALKGAKLDASGVAGGGNVRVGGDFHGGGTLATSAATTVDAVTTIKADATGAQGNGGTVVVWSDQATAFAGNISARGGTEGGDGGSVEVSSKGWLGYVGLTDLRATAGRTGTLLLDPENVTISTAATSVTYVPVTLGGVTTYTPVADDSNINNTDLSNALGSANVTVNTGATGAQAGTIMVTAPVAWGNANTLTLTAASDITLSANITAATGTLTLTSGGVVTQPGGVVTVANLNGSSTGATTLNAANVIGTLGNYTAGGGFALTNNAALTAGGVISAGGALALTTTTAGLTVNSAGTLTAGTAAAGNLTLTSAAGITQSGGTITLGTNAGAAAILTLNAQGGNISQTAGTITTGGVAGNRALSLQATGTISQSGALAAANLSGQAGGNTSLAGAVGTLTGFTVSNGGGTFSLNDTGDLTVSGVVRTGQAAGPVVGGAISLTAAVLTLTGTVTDSSTTAGTGALVTLNGTTSLGIGGTINSGSLSTGATTATFNAGESVTTFNSGGQVYNGPVVLATDTSLTANNNGLISFISTVNSAAGTPHSLSLATGGTQGFGNAVGTTPLSSLTTTGTGQVNLAGPSVTTVGVQQYGGPVLLAGPTSLTTTNSVISAPSINNAGVALTVNAGSGNVTLGGANHALTVLTGNGTDTFTAGTLTLNGVVSAGSLSATTTVSTNLFNNVTTNTANTGTQSYNAVLLGAGVTLSTSNSNLTADSINTAGHDLTVSAGTGSVTLGGTGANHSLTVLTSGNPTTPTGADVFTTASLTLNGVVDAGSLTVNPASTTTLYNNVTTAGAQSYDALALGASATLTGTTFGATSVAGGGFDLTLAFSNAVNISGIFTGVRNLTSNGTGGTNLSGTVTTTGFQLYSNAVTLTGITSLASSGSGSDITFGSTVDSDGTNRSLTINTSGNEIFNGLVGNTSALSALTTDSAITPAGQAQFNMTAGANGGVNVAGNVAINDSAVFNVANSTQTTPSVKTTGTQTYSRYNNLLGADTYLLSTGAITLGSTTAPATGNNDALDNATAANPHSLTLKTNGAVVIRGLVGEQNRIGGLDVEPGSTGVTISGDAALGLGFIRTTGQQNYYVPVTLANNITFSTTLSGFAGGIYFGSTFSSDSAATRRNLTTDTQGGNTVFGLSSGTGAVTLNNLTTSALGQTLIGFSSLTTAGAQNYQGATQVQVVNLSLTAGTTIAFGGALTSNQSSPNTILTTNAPGAIGTTFSSTVGSTTTPFDSVSVTGTSSIGNSIFTINNQTFGGNATLAGTATLNSTSGSIFFNGTLAAATAGVPALTIDLTDNTKSVNFANTVGGGGNTLAGLNVLRGTTNITGPVGAGAISTTGNQNYGGAVAATVPVTFSATTGSATFGGALSSTGTITITAAGGIAINGGTVTSVGGQTYNNPTTLGANTVMTDTGAGAAVTFATGATLDSSGSQRTLEIDTPGDEIFGALVGSNLKLASLTTDATGTVGGGTHFNMTVSGAGVAGVDVGAGGVTLNDRVFFNVTGSSSNAVPTALAGAGTNNPSVRSTGAQQYLFAGTPALLQQNTVLQGTTLTLAGGVNGLSGGTNHNLTLNFSDTASPTVVTGAQFTNINGFANVGANGTQISGSFQTSGYQYYGNSSLTPATTLTGNTQLSSTGSGTIRFDSRLDGLFTLAIDTAGDEVFNNLVGSAIAGGLTSLRIDTGVTPGIAAGGTATFGMDVTGQTSGTAGVRVGTGGVIVNDSVAFNVAGSVQGSVAAPLTLQSVQSAGVQTYNGVATLGQDTVLTNTAGGTIAFAQTINGQRNLVLNSAGNETFGGLVGNLTPLLSVATDADALYRGGTASFNVAGGIGVTTVNNVASPGTATGAQTYNDAVLIAQDATFSSTALAPATGGGAVTFNGTVDSTGGAHNLTVLAGPGQTVFGTGATTINAAALNIFGAQVTFNQSVGATGPLNILTVGRNGTQTGVTPSIDINNGGFTTTSATGQTYNDALFLSANTTLTASAGNILFLGTVDSGNPLSPTTTYALTLNATAGSVTFSAVSLVGSVLPLTSLTTSSATGTIFAANLGVGQTAVKVGAGGISITGPAIFNGTGSSLTNLNRATFNSGGAITFNGAVTLNQDASFYSPGSGDIAFNGAVDGPSTRDRGLALNTAGNEIFNAGAVVGGTNPLLSLTVDTLLMTPGGQTQLLMNAAAVAGLRVGAGGVTINDGVRFGATNTTLARPTVLVYNGGTQTYNGAASVAANTFLVGDSTGVLPVGGTYSGGGAISFALAVTGTTGAQNLSVYTGTGTTNLLDNVSVGSLSVGGANVTFNGQVNNLAQFNVVPNGSNGNINSTAATITTTGTQTYNAPLLLGRSLVQSAGGDILFASTVNSQPGGPFSLSASSTGGNITFSDRVGFVRPLLNLTTTGAGTTFLLSPAATTGGVITSGFQSYGTTNGTQVGTVAALTAGTDISFLTRLDGTPAAADTTLTLTASGQILFAAPVGGTTPLTQLTATAPTIQVNGGSVTTRNAQTYAGSTLLGNNTLLTSQNNGNVTFNGPLNGAFTLSVATGGNTVFGGVVGGSAPLASLTTDTPGATLINGGLVTTTGAQNYGDAVTLGAATTLNGASVSFALTLNGLYALAVNATGNTVFGGVVGGSAPLASLTTDAGGTTLINGGAVTTTGTQGYGDGVLLGANTVLTGGGVSFGQTLDGTFTLRVNTGGSTAFGGLVGSLAPLASLTTDAGGVTFISGGGVTTTGGQDYGDAVTLGKAAVLKAATVVFRQTLDGTFALTLNVSGATTFNGPVGGNVPLASLTTDAPGTTALNGGLVTTTGAQIYGDPVILGTDTLLNGASVNFAQSLNGGYNLTINAPGDTVFGGPVGTGGPLTSLTTNGGGTTFINGGGVTTTGDQNYDDAVALGANASLNGQGITFSQTLDGPGGLSILAGGDVTFGGLAGSGTPLLNLTVNAVGTTFLNGGGVRTLGFQTYNNKVTLGSPTTTLTSLNTVGDNGAILFALTVDGASALTVNTTGNTVFNQAVGGSAPLASLTTDLGGTTILNGGSVTTTGAQNYGDAVALGANTLLTGSDVAFGNSLDGAYALTTLAGGSTIFGGLVGGIVPLTQLTVNSAANPGADVQFNMTLGGTARAGVLVNGAVAVYGPVRFNAAGSSLTQPTVLTFSTNPQVNITQSYNGAVTVAANTALVSSSAQSGNAGDPFAGGQSVTFSAGVDSMGGGAGLQVRGGVGNAVLPGTVSADSVDVGGAAVAFGGNIALGGQLSVEPNDGEGGGVIQLGGGNVTTRNGQTFNAPVLLGANTLFTTSAAGDITFNSDLDGAVDLTIDTVGNTTIQGAVGSGTILRSVDITGAAFINGGLVRTSGQQLFEGDLTLAPGNGATTTLRATDGNLLFYGNVNATQSGLLVQGNRIAVRGDMETGGDLDLESQNSGEGSPLLVLEGANYRSDNGNVYFNRADFSLPDNNDAAATIILTNPDKTNIRAAGNFEVGYQQKIFSFGALSISASKAIIGDVAAHDTLKISASEVDLLARPAGVANSGAENTGLNIVAVNGIDFGGAKIVFNTQNDPNATASFITSNSNVNIQRVQGISLFRNPGLDNASFRTAISNYQQIVNNKAVSAETLPLINTGGNFLTQPIGGGTLSLDTAAALSGALPDQKPVDVAAEITITASQMEELKKLGIHPRLAQKSERRASGKRALFAQLVDGQDPDNYGQLQPIKGGISSLVPSDYVVVVDRMGEREVSSILQSFEQVYGKNKEKAPEIGAAFQTAFTDYTVQKQTADPAGFGPFLEKQKNKYPAVNKAVRNFDDLFGHIEHLGLTEKEVFKSEEHIVSDLGVQGPSAEDMVRVINGLRKKLPPGQQAPSTKAPQSVPASNPAPGATSPAGSPAPKKAPLKTADREGENAPVKSARRAPVREKARPELAGL